MGSYLYFVEVGLSFPPFVIWLLFSLLHHPRRKLRNGPAPQNRRRCLDVIMSTAWPTYCMHIVLIYAVATMSAGKSPRDIRKPWDS